MNDDDPIFGTSTVIRVEWTLISSGPIYLDRFSCACGCECADECLEGER